MVLVDTSVWIDYFRADNPAYEVINGLVEGRNVAIAGLILAELIQGAKGAKEVSALDDLALVIPLLKEPPDNWRTAGRLSYELRRKGNTIGLADCYIAVLSVANRVKLLSMDRHFEIIAKHYPVELISFEDLAGSSK